MARSDNNGPFWLFWSGRPAVAIAFATAIALLATGAALGLNGTEILGWQAATRATAVVAFPFWLLVFTASSWARLLPNATTRLLRARRRALGLAFAAAITVHGGAILMLSTFDEALLTFDVSVIGGGFGFLMVFAMAATSTDAAVRRLGGAKWRALHNLGQLTLAIVYLVTYGGRVAADLDFLPGLGLLLAAIGLRGAASLQSRRLRSTRLPTE